MRYAVFWKWSALYDEVSKLADGSGIVGIVVSPDNLRRDAGWMLALQRAGWSHFHRGRAYSR
jgi:hypothetical protein